MGDSGEGGGVGGGGRCGRLRGGGGGAGDWGKVWETEGRPGGHHPPNLYHKRLSDFETNCWDTFISELESRAPTLLHIMLTLVSFNDRRNKIKVGASHHPGVCAAVAILLKERSKNMCGLQSLVFVWGVCDGTSDRITDN